VDYRFGVCVPPLFGRVRPRTVIEFIEMTRLLGAQHFIFYASNSVINDDVQTSDVDIGQVLRLYVDRGLATVIPWTLPPVTSSSSSGIWYGGQLQAINDCLYRSMHAFDRVVFNDLDEYVVARWPLSDWSLMADRFDQYFHWNSTFKVFIQSSAVTTKKSRHRRQRRYCAFSFRSAFFDPMTPPSVAYIGAGSGKTMTSSLNSVAYELESDIRTEIFSAVRTKVMIDVVCIPILIFRILLPFLQQFYSINQRHMTDSHSVRFVYHTVSQSVQSLRDKLQPEILTGSPEWDVKQGSGD